MEKGFVVAFIALLANLLAVKAQLDLFITKRDVNSYLKLNFDLDLYLIKDNEPVTLLKDSRGFYDFMSPLQSTVNGVKLSWFSSPQSTKYSLKLSSSDHEIVRNPVASIQPQGVVPHSVVSFFISLDCTGKKGGMVDVSMQLNYTKIVATSVNSSSQKTLFLQVKKLCEKTVKDKETQPKPVHWSRGAIVGLSAGITVFLCLCVGLVLLFKHYMKQRKLKMEFEDDLDLEDKRQFCLKKVTSLPVHRPSSGGPKSPPQILYSPKRVKIKVPRQRQRSETNGSDTSTLELICKEECDDDKQPGEETTIKDGWSDRVADVLLNAEHLEIKEQIGTGACGDVYHGFLKELKDNNISEVREVSVEVYRGGKEDEVSKQLLVAAIHQAKEFNHPNIIKPIGVVLNPTVQVVTPYMEYTTLNDFLRQHSDTVSHKQLMTIAINIANALEYLNQNNIHKGLSSKECMIDENGDVKISTFHNTTNTRWMAPECFTSGLYSEKSDVWSFGVMLWQMTTHGELPYPEIHTDELFNYLQSGNRLQQNCSNQLYSVMLLCWSLDPISRPTLHWLIDWLNTYVQSLDTNSQMLV